MTDDPAGYYALLDIDPTATPDAIGAAFRRKARVLHPDIPGTGNADAFVRVKLAYEVLRDARRRAAYDNAARAAMAASKLQQGSSPNEPVIRGPRFSDLPLPLWIGLGGLFCVAAFMAIIELTRSLPPASPPVARPFAPSVASAMPANAPPLKLAGGAAATHYVLPGGGEAVVWRHDARSDSYEPVGQVADFSPVQAVQAVPQHGLAEIRLAGGGSGFIDMARLAPGDPATAHRAYCAYNAGAPPNNGEVLARHGTGGATLEIENHGGEPAVVKLRDATGRAAASVFIAVGGTAVLEDLPDMNYRPEIAVGELWSRACDAFTVGMRAQRYTAYAPPSGLSPIVIPPDLSQTPAPVDISDEAFERK